MDFKDTAAEAAFRNEVRAWLDANAQRRQHAEEKFGAGLSPQEYLAAAKAWQARKVDAGYAAIAWPKAVGGCGGTPIQQVIYQQEEADFLVPQGVFTVGMGMALPTVMMWGTPAQQARYLPSGLAGDEIWCQLFSEPVAGSDTGGIRTRAQRRGDGWVIDGQKVWSSNAHCSDWGILLARSDWDKPRTKGLTMFLLDMKSPGVEVRPIHQMSGECEFNEVFLTDVRIPDSLRLGGEGEGWNVMLSTLMHERLSVGGAFPVDLHRRLIALARQCRWDGKPAVEDARVRARIADAYLSQRGVDLIVMRGLTALSRGGMPGPEMAVTKLVAGKGIQDICSFAQEMAGAEGLLPAEELDVQWQHIRWMWLMAPGMRLGGGTDEILRNVIAERVLGLPSEVRTDKDVPFRELEGVGMSLKSPREPPAGNP